MILTIFVFVVTINIVSISQIDYNKNNFHSKNESLFTFIKYDAISSYNTGIELLQSPLNFNKNDLILTGFLLAMTGASSSLDNKVRTEALKSKSLTMDKITNIGENFGSGIYSSIFSVLLYSGGYIFSDNRIKETGQMLVEAIICNGLITQTLKIALGRERPFLSGKNTNFDLLEFEFESEENSLPSGHTSTAFTFATVLSERIDNIYASVALYSLASLSAYQRIYSDSHWLSDTVLGAAIGIFVGLKIVSLHEDKLSKEDHFNLRIFPQVSASSYGVGFALQF